jgi:hypothetical protein
MLRLSSSSTNLEKRWSQLVSVPAGPVAWLPRSSHADFENFIEPVSSTNPKVELGSKDIVFEDRVGFNVLAAKNDF